MEYAALAVSVIALLLSGAAAWYSRQQAHHQALATSIELDRRREEVAHRRAEEDRLRLADVDVKLATRGTRLVLSNTGPAAASEVSVAFERPLSGDGGRDGAFDLIESRRFELSQGDQKQLSLSPDGDTASRYEVSVRWIDQAGPHHRVRVIDHG